MNKDMFIPSSIYQDILSYIPIPTVDILFLNPQGQLLLAKRNNEPLKGIYYIPGGRVFKGEKSLDTAKRKAQEELGINIDTGRLRFIGVYDDIFDNSAFDNISTHCIPVTYLYQLTHEEEGLLTIGDTQHADFGFFSMEDTALHEMVKMRIRDIKILLKI